MLFRLRVPGAPLATLILCSVFCSSSVPAQDADTDAGNVWLRQLFAAEANGPAELQVHGLGTATVYVNGQRLVRNVDLASTVRTFDIRPLIRAGRNSVCVAISSAPQPKLSLTLRQNESRTLDQWKAATDPPPVGWQQTDFNDRDWKAMKPETPAQAPERTETVAWRSADAPKRFQANGFSFRDQDHVVLIGGTFIERAQQFGHLESALNSDPEKYVTFRNLGWSADTVLAESRGIFDTPEKGYERLIEHVRAEEPDVVLLCYGQNEAMSFPQGEDGLKQFREGLSCLIRDIRTTGAEVVILSVHPLLPMPAPLPDPSRWNSTLAKYAQSAAAVADELDVGFVDLFENFHRDLVAHHADVAHQHLPSVSPEDHPELLQQLATVWTDNGMHWNETGYAAVGPLVADRLFGEFTAATEVNVNPLRQTVEAVTGAVTDIQWINDEPDILKFAVQPTRVAGGYLRLMLTGNDPAFVVTIRDESSGGTTLAEQARVKRGDQLFVQYSAPPGPSYEHLRQLVLRKNELYFHRWRPQNITYLFGFRKHEQGNNASEIAQFDPLIAELESQIQQAKQPQKLQVQLQSAAD